MNEKVYGIFMIIGGAYVVFAPPVEWYWTIFGIVFIGIGFVALIKD